LVGPSVNLSRSLGTSDKGGMEDQNISAAGGSENTSDDTVDQQDSRMDTADEEVLVLHPDFFSSSEDGEEALLTWDIVTRSSNDGKCQMQLVLCANSGSDTESVRRRVDVDVIRLSSLQSLGNCDNLSLCVAVREGLVVNDHEYLLVGLPWECHKPSKENALLTSDEKEAAQIWVLRREYLETNVKLASLTYSNPKLFKNIQMDLPMQRAMVLEMFYHARFVLMAENQTLQNDKVSPNFYWRFLNENPNPKPGIEDMFNHAMAVAGSTNGIQDWKEEHAHFSKEVLNHGLNVDRKTKEGNEREDTNSHFNDTWRTSLDGLRAFLKKLDSECQEECSQDDQLEIVCAHFNHWNQRHPDGTEAMNPYDILSIKKEIEVLEKQIDQARGTDTGGKKKREMYVQARHAGLEEKIKAQRQMAQTALQQVYEAAYFIGNVSVTAEDFCTFMDSQAIQNEKAFDGYNERPFDYRLSESLVKLITGSEGFNTTTQQDGMVVMLNYSLRDGSACGPMGDKHIKRLLNPTGRSDFQACLASEILPNFIQNSQDIFRVLALKGIRGIPIAGQHRTHAYKEVKSRFSDKNYLPATFSFRLYDRMPKSVSIATSRRTQESAKWRTKDVKAQSVLRLAQDILKLHNETQINRDLTPDEEKRYRNVYSDLVHKDLSKHSTDTGVQQERDIFQCVVTMRPEILGLYIEVLQKDIACELPVQMRANSNRLLELMQKSAMSRLKSSTIMSSNCLKQILRAVKRCNTFEELRDLANDPESLLGQSNFFQTQHPGYLEGANVLDEGEHQEKDLTAVHLTSKHLRDLKNVSVYGQRLLLTRLMRIAYTTFADWRLEVAAVMAMERAMKLVVARFIWDAEIESIEIKDYEDYESLASVFLWTFVKLSMAGEGEKQRLKQGGATKAEKERMGSFNRCSESLKKAFRSINNGQNGIPPKLHGYLAALEEEQEYIKDSDDEKELQRKENEMVDNDSGVPGQRTGATSTQRSKNKKSMKYRSEINHLLDQRAIEEVKAFFLRDMALMIEEFKNTYPDVPTNAKELIMRRAFTKTNWASLNPGVWLEIPDDVDALQTVRETPGKRQDAAPTPVVVDQGIMCALRQAAPTCDKLVRNQMVGVNVSVSKKDGFPTLKFSKWVDLETVPQAAVHPRWETSTTNLKKCAKLMEVFLRTEGEHWNKDKVDDVNCFRTVMEYAASKVAASKQGSKVRPKLLLVGRKRFPPAEVTNTDLWKTASNELPFFVQRGFLGVHRTDTFRNNPWMLTVTWENVRFATNNQGDQFWEANAVNSERVEVSLFEESEVDKDNSDGQDCSTHLLDPDDPNVLVLDGNNVDFCRAYGTRTVKIAESAAKLEEDRVKEADHQKAAAAKKKAEKKGKAGSKRKRTDNPDNSKGKKNAANDEDLYSPPKQHKKQADMGLGRTPETVADALEARRRKDNEIQGIGGMCLNQGIARSLSTLSPVVESRDEAGADLEHQGDHNTTPTLRRACADQTRENISYSVAEEQKDEEGIWRYCAGCCKVFPVPKAGFPP